MSMAANEFDAIGADVVTAAGLEHVTLDADGARITSNVYAMPAGLGDDHPTCR
jgi:hypothetical protein